MDYDGSFEGLLTAIFEIYEYKIATPFICVEGNASGSLFGETHHVITDKIKAQRVYKKLQEKLTLNAQRQLYKAFLSETKEVENLLYRYIRYAIDNKQGIENNFIHPDVLQLQQLSRKVDREKHRMEAFVRFQLTKDQLYYAIIQPDFNVLPLIQKHFKERYADQCWLIYDSRRKYGLYYDKNAVTEVQINFEADLNNEAAKQNIYDEDELLYQHLWQQYFSSVNIKARKNMKLHIQHMPKRYWRYLTEKQ
jgi:probable DNA metabolism protein